MPSNESGDALSMALLVGAIALFAAVVPIWPYGYYVLLRLVVTAVAVYALLAGSSLGPGHRVALVVIALLFNPLIPVYLTRAVWFPIDIGVGAYFLVMKSRITGSNAGPPAPAGPDP